MKVSSSIRAGARESSDPGNVEIRGINWFPPPHSFFFLFLFLPPSPRRRFRGPVTTCSCAEPADVTLGTQGFAERMDAFYGRGESEPSDESAVRLSRGDIRERRFCCLRFVVAERSRLAGHRGPLVLWPCGVGLDHFGRFPEGAR